MRNTVAICAAAAALLVSASCGGSDGDTTDGPAAPAAEPATTEPAGDQSGTEEPAADDATPGEPADEAAVTLPSEPVDDAAVGDVGERDVGERCRAMISDAEIDALFGEPWVLDASETESLGQTVCSWTTLDEDDDDFFGAILVAQVYSGDPISGEAFIDPSVFGDDVTMIEDIGDLAFSAGPLRTDFLFYDDPVAGTLGYSEFNFGSDEPDNSHDSADIEALFRTFHDRVT